MPDTADKTSDGNNNKSERVKDFGTSNIVGRHGRISCISIIGQVEGHIELEPTSKTTKYEHLIPIILSVEEDKNIDGLLVILNTMGGDVEAGLAIAELIASMSKPTVSLVLGGGHSIGVPLAVSSDYSFIVPSSTMLVHPIRLNGAVISSAQSFDYLKRMQNRVTDFIVRNSRIDKDSFIKLIMSSDELSNDTGTVLYGSQAVDVGLINEVGGISKALDKLSELINNK